MAENEKMVRELDLLNEDLTARLDEEPSNTEADDEDVAEEEVANSKGGIVDEWEVIYIEYIIIEDGAGAETHTYRWRIVRSTSPQIAAFGTRRRLRHRSYGYVLESGIKHHRKSQNQKPVPGVQLKRLGCLERWQAARVQCDILGSICKDSELACENALRFANFSSKSITWCAQTWGKADSRVVIKSELGVFLPRDC
ncbi:uncharacterized protein [Physcomitrium patens]|uniref:uncharacterized protein n=1 Tax=Physcomitrium patens TaxID=3218 RepID=UPI003CCCC096